MSIEMMTLVWRRSKNSGSVLLIELAIADHAHDDGTGAYPSIARLTRYARQCERNARYLLRKVEESKEVITVPGGGPRGTNAFQINVKLLRTYPDQIDLKPKGAKFAPQGAKFAPLQKNARGGQKNAGGGQSSVKGGQNRVNHRGQSVAPDPDPSLNRHKNRQEPSSSAQPDFSTLPDDVSRNAQMMMMELGIDAYVAIQLAQMPHVNEEYLRGWYNYNDHNSAAHLKNPEKVKALGPGFFVQHIRAGNPSNPFAPKQHKEMKRNRAHTDDENGAWTCQ